VKGSNFQLISQIVHGQWLIDDGFAQKMMPLVARMLQGEPVSFYDTSEEENEEVSAAYVLAPQGSGRMVKMEHAREHEIPSGSIAVIPQRGVVMKENFCGIAGTAQMREELNTLMDNPNIGAAIIVADSPGGAVNGTFEYCDAIYTSKKPVIGFVDGLAASAAYAILSGSGEIYASHESAVIGSIGVMITLRDYSDRLKELGIKEETFTSTTSPNKNSMYTKALNGEPEDLEAFLDAQHAIFMNSVRRTRTEVTDETMDGSVYLANEAKDRDLIDGIMTFEKVTERAQELIDIMQLTSI